MPRRHLALAAWLASAAVGGLKVATPQLRVGDPAGTGRGSVVVKLGGEAVSVSFSVAELGDAVALPHGVHLEDGPGLGTFTEVSIQLLADEGDAPWRFDQVGQAAGGPVCTVRLATDEDVWWEMGVIGAEHYVIVRYSGTDPATLVSAQFVLHLGGTLQGKPTLLIESLQFPGEFLRDQGHILTANGVKVAPGGGALFMLR
ncbi:MAG: hypothetical protein FJ296_02195 [Planctomycetes bacterium]|nr:hypothetical protein [Planctomycetota bacterium]